MDWIKHGDLIGDYTFTALFSGLHILLGVILRIRKKCDVLLITEAQLVFTHSLFTIKEVESQPEGFIVFITFIRTPTSDIKVALRHLA